MNIPNRLLGEVRGLLDLLLPAICPLCEVRPAAPDGGFCCDCRRQIPPPGPPHCPLCALPFLTSGGENHRCEACLREPPPFSAVRAAGCYEDLLGQAIRDLKYGHRPDLARHLGELLAERLAADPLLPPPDLILPVPLHPLRLRQRTFNQALLLARVLARRLDLPLRHRCLRRSRATIPQQGLKAAERRANLRGAFTLREPVAGRRILLVDDVMTTGATARECSRILLEGGAHSVTVAVLGRARRLPA